MTNNIINDLEKIIVSRDNLAAKVKELGSQIRTDYQPLTNEILVVGILRGAVVFMADLVRAIDFPVSFDFMAVSSYGSSAHSSGIVRILKDLEENIEGKHVLIVEDIIDSGLTLSYLMENLKSRNPASLKICTLLNKPSRRKANIAPDYNGFDIEDLFVVGYGLDFDGKYRNLPFIAELKSSVYS